jgi:uncharacterized RDD family membrane protein YckC
VSPQPAPRAQALQRRRAGFVSRVLANAIDLGVIALLGVLLLLFASVVVFLATNQRFHLLDPQAWVAGVALLVIQILYLAQGWSGITRTVGKELVGLRVVTPTGRPLGYGRGFVRAVVCTAIGQPLLLWSIVSKRNAAVYDLVLRTAVVYDWRTPGEVLEAEEAGVAARRDDAIDLTDLTDLTDLGGPQATIAVAVPSMPRDGRATRAVQTARSADPLA